MYDQMEVEDCFVFATLAPAQTDVALDFTIFENDDLTVTRDGTLCSYAAVPLTVTQYSLVYTAGVQGGTVRFGAVAVGGEDVVVERVMDAFRRSQYPVSGPVPIASVNDDMNFYTAAIQTAARWVTYMLGCVRLPLGQTISGTIQATPDTIIGFDSDGNIQNLDATGLLDIVGAATISPTQLATLLETVLVAGDNVVLVNNGNGTFTIEVDLGGDLLLLEGDMQSGAGGGGNTPFYTTENAQDDVAAMLAFDANLSGSYNDATGVYTISYIGAAGGITAEQAMDAVAAMLVETLPVQAVYDDATDTYTLSLDQTELKPPLAYTIPLCGDATAVAITHQRTFRAPFAMTLTGVRASLATAQATGALVTFDVLEAGVSIFTTDKVTIDNTEKTSTTALTGANRTDSAIADDAEVTIKCTQIGDGTAKGAVVTLLYRRA